MTLFSDFSLVSYDANNRFLWLVVVNYSKACFQLDLAFLFWPGDAKSLIFHYIEFSVPCYESIEFVKNNFCLWKLLPFDFLIPELVIQWIFLPDNYINSHLLPSPSHQQPITFKLFYFIYKEALEVAKNDCFTWISPVLLGVSPFFINFKCVRYFWILFCVTITQMNFSIDTG